MLNLGEEFLEVVWQDLCQDFFKDLRITVYHRVSVISWSVTRVSTIQSSKFLDIFIGRCLPSSSICCSSGGLQVSLCSNLSLKIFLVG